MSDLMRWEPRRDLLSLREAMDRLFEESFVRPFGSLLFPAGAEPFAVDMYETADAVTVKAILPGVKPQDLEVSVTGDILTIRGKAEEEEEVKDRNYLRRECRYGSFCRSIALPAAVVTDKAEASFENGILTLTLPKAEEVKPKTIKVKTRK